MSVYSTYNNYSGVSKKKNEMLNICMFIAVFFSSMLGSTLFGISMNKLCLIPLLVYFIVSKISNRVKLSFNKNIILFLLFYIVSILSAVYSLSAEYSQIDEYKKRTILFIVQIIFIYIPLLVFVSNYSDKKSLLESLKKCIVITCRIHVFFAILQFTVYLLFSFDISKVILPLFYEGELSSSTLINLLPLGIFVRPTGLNYDPAYFGIVMVLGFIFDRKKTFRFIYFIASCIAMSRVSIVVMVVIYLFGLKSKKILLKNVIFLLVILALCFMVYFSIESIRNQVNALISRFNLTSNTSNTDVGTMRHILYIPKSIEILTTKYNFVQLMIGYGPRNSGTIITYYGVMDKYLQPDMFNASWATECDFSELLLGYGIIGTVTYVLIVLKLYSNDTKLKKLLLAILLFGIMYDISSSTLVQLLLICFVSVASKEKVMVMNKEVMKYEAS